LAHFSRIALGSSAVYAFFTLSGYWIYVMYKRRYSVATSPYIAFIISRFWRILPIFWLANLFTIGIHLTTDPWTRVVADFGPTSIIPNVFVLGYIHWNDLKYLGQAWSLDIEMQFYLVAPLLIITLERWNRAAGAALVLAGILGLVLSDGDKGTAFNLLLFFATGMLAAHVDWVPSRKIAGTSALAGAAFVAILIALQATRGLFIAGAHRDPMELATVDKPMCCSHCLPSHSRCGR
jgi:peptidoglycan/LPS O-acetylase OafA/YrhL